MRDTISEIISAIKGRQNAGHTSAAHWSHSAAIIFAAAAHADPSLTSAENQFLSDLLVPKDSGNGRLESPVHPPLTPPALVKMGHQACTDIRNGVSPDVERDNLDIVRAIIERRKNLPRIP